MLYTIVCHWVEAPISAVSRGGRDYILPSAVDDASVVVVVVVLKKKNCANVTL